MAIEAEAACDADRAEVAAADEEDMDVTPLCERRSDTLAARRECLLRRTVLYPFPRVCSDCVRSRSVRRAYRCSVSEPAGDPHAPSRHRIRVPVSRSSGQRGEWRSVPDRPHKRTEREQEPRDEGATPQLGPETEWLSRYASAALRAIERRGTNGCNCDDAEGTLGRREEGKEGEGLFRPVGHPFHALRLRCPRWCEKNAPATGVGHAREAWKCQSTISITQNKISQ